MRAPLIVFAVVFLFLGGLFVVIGGSPLLDAWRYRQAAATDAVVTSASLRPATDTSGTEYELSYRAEIDQRVHERTETVPVHVWERAKPGGVVRVAHLSGDPESVRVVTDSKENAQSLVFAVIGLLMLLAALISGRRAMRWREVPDEVSQPVSPIAIPAHEPSYWPLARRSPRFWTGAIALLVATPLVVAGTLQVWEEWQFARHGVSADGMVLTKEIKLPGRNQQSRKYDATYRVVLPEGAFENRVRLSYADWARLKEREAVAVVYLPEHPASNRLAGSRPWLGAAFLMLLGSLFFSIGATFLRRSIRQARLEWRLRQHGAATGGVVIEIRDRQLKINGVSQWRLRYEYDDFRGGRHAATHDLPEDEALQWEPGAVGAVRYDPGRPADAIWLGRSS